MQQPTVQQKALKPDLQPELQKVLIKVKQPETK